MAVRDIPGRLEETRRRYLRPPAPLFFPDEELVPETGFHLRIRTALFLVLERELRGRAFVGSDQFVYWDAANPKACLAPDIIVRMGAPFEIVRSYKIWEHGAPHLAVEIVSKDDRRDRDWTGNLERYRRTGIGEIVRFDAEDEAAPLRLWDNVEGDLVERDLSDPEGLRCDVLGAYWTVVPDAVLVRVLRLARNPDGTDLWLTPDERIAELERELERRR
jgi:Uma2 family endonuclease